MDVDAASGVLGRRPDFIIQRSESLDRAANRGRPLVTSDPTDSLVADLKLLAGSIAAGVPAALERLDA
jgi:Flp pilus assembly CpaE family ATPase